ncbi:hypothetical protein [Glycomyces buryatensis]|uniref:DUF3168 domain-containing protein n=1 Tax=Glycomyces buryatensis TaxID=2570927 RepID=A0A4S8QER1_9ACTN|nr:hypothetical protein [Glycomyces buryatensis]THV41395.1 hypothetical protein FAB82_11380 [Glycomyces buryatensis]
MSLQSASYQELKKAKAAVVACLDKAGIPWCSDPVWPDHRAVSVSLENDDDFRGILFYWTPPARGAAARAAYNAGDRGYPEVMGDIGSDSEAIEWIGRLLAEAGIVTEDYGDRMSPDTLYVVEVR